MLGLFLQRDCRSFPRRCVALGTCRARVSWRKCGSFSSVCLHSLSPSSAGLRVCGARPAASTPLAGRTAAPAAETRHGPHQARGRGGPQRGDGLEFGHRLGQAFRAGILRSPERIAGTNARPLPARHADRRQRGEARPLSSPSSVSPSRRPRPRLPRVRRPPGITGRRRAAGTAPPCDGAARRAPTWSGPGRHGQAASRAGAAAQPEQEAEEAPAGVRRGAPVL